MPPLPADFIHPRSLQTILRKILDTALFGVVSDGFNLPTASG